MKTNRTPGTTAVDWDRIKRRLAAADAALASGFAPSPEKQREILRARTLALAAEPAQAMAPGEAVEVVEFMLAQERYAVEAAWVHEVHPLKELTPLPCTPPFVSGIINVHGRILTVIDLKRFFELPDAGLTDLNKVIILKHEGTEFGILADRIVAANRLPLAALQTSLPTLTGVRADYLLGVTPDRLVLLDAKRLLTDPRLVVDEEVGL